MEASIKKMSFFAKRNCLPLKVAISVVAVGVAPMSFTLRARGCISRRGLSSGALQTKSAYEYVTQAALIILFKTVSPYPIPRREDP